jgi:DHA1 family tetracycline resistance protein-like MFS transporter
MPHWRHLCLDEKLKGSHALIFVFITALMDSVGFGIIMPVMPQLVMEVTGEGLSSAATYGGLLMFAYAGMQFFLAPVIGNVSDRFGRRPVLLISLLVLGIDYLIMWWAPTFAWLLLGRVIAGAAASTFSTCNAFIADISEPDKRAQNFGLIGAAFGMGFVIGPVIGGFLGEYGARAPFLAAAAFSFTNLLYGALVLPETLAKDQRRPFEWRRANPTGTLRALRRYPMVFGLIGAYFLFQLGHHVLPATWSYFTMEKFDWSPREIGYSLGAVGIMMVLVQAVLLRWVLPRFGSRRTAIAGFGFCLISFVGYAFATQGWMIYLFLIPGAMQGLANPAIQGIMSNQVGASEQGELQGGLASISSLTSILSPLFMTQLFAFFTATNAPIYFPGAPFLAAAVLTVMALAVFLKTTSSVHSEQLDSPPPRRPPPRRPPQRSAPGG